MNVACDDRSGVETIPWMWLTAPLAGLIYYVLSRAIGDVFPFSRYAMYASTAMRSEGAVPFFRADGCEARIDDFTDFVGIDPGGVYPEGFPCSLEWRVREWQRWLEGHTSEVPDVDGPIRIEIGFRMLAVDEEGVLTEQIQITQEGTAWPMR